MTSCSPPLRALLSLVLSTLTAGCVLGPEPKFPRIIAEGAYCTPRHAMSATPAAHGADAVDLPASAAVSAMYSTHILDIARVIGALDLLGQLEAAKGRGAPNGELAELRGQINDAISVARLDLETVVADLACEQGRASQIAADLRAAEQSQTRTLTAYSLVIGAIAAVGAGVLSIADKNPTPAGIVGIGGGLAGGAFGFATLAVHRKATFRHTPNILGQLWDGGSHSTFPDAVWAYLTRPQFSRTSDRSIRDTLVLAWSQSGRLGEDAARPSPTLTGLYFGPGGTYDADGLEARANMLSEVREVVSLMSYPLQRLATAVMARR